MTTQESNQLRLVPLAWQGERLLPVEELAAREEQGEKQEVTILYTTDFHSSVVSGPRLPPGVGGIARIATTIKLAREAGPTLVLDNGDAVFGESSWWDAQGATTTARLRAAAGCDLASLGNHDLEHGLEGLGELFEGGYPFVAANLSFDDPRYRERVHPASIAELAGWRIGLIGLTTPETVHMLPARLRQSWQLADPLESLRATLRELEPLVDTVVLLSHLGYVVGPELGDRSLAPQLSGSKVSVILGGHTHGALIPAPVIAGIVVCNAGACSEYVGEVKLAWHAGQAVEVRARLIRQDEAVAEDGEMVALRTELAQAFAPLHETTFILPTLPKLGADGLTVRFGPWVQDRDAEAILLAKAVHELPQAQQSDLLLVPLLYMSGQIPTQKSEISQAELFQVYANSEHLVELEIAGRDLKSLLARQATMIFFQQALPLWLEQQKRVKEEHLEDERLYRVMSVESVRDGTLGWSTIPQLAQSSRELNANCYEAVQQYFSQKKEA